MRPISDLSLYRVISYKSFKSLRATIEGVNDKCGLKLKNSWIRETLVDRLLDNAFRLPSVRQALVYEEAYEGLEQMEPLFERLCYCKLNIIRRAVDNLATHGKIRDIHSKTRRALIDRLVQYAALNDKRFQEVQQLIIWDF